MRRAEVMVVVMLEGRGQEARGKKARGKRQGARGKRQEGKRKKARGKKRPPFYSNPVVHESCAT